MLMADLRVLMITQMVDRADPLLGFTHTWVNALAERVAHLHVLALSVGQHDLPENVTLHSMGKERGARRVRRLWNFTRVVAPLALRRRVDVAFVHMAPLYAILAAPWARLARLPVVMWYAHGHVSPTLKLAHLLVDKVVSSTSEGFRLPSQKLVVVGQGIDIGIFRPPERPRSERSFTVLGVGRISPVKDYETLLEAAHILVNQRGCRDLRFVVVGDVGTPEQEAYLQRLREMVQLHRLEGWVEFAGGVLYGRVVDYYWRADAFVSTSRTGSLDKAGLEAMACGLPLLTCNEAFADLLGDLSNKLMFEQGNAEQLASKLLDVMEMKSENRGAVVKALRDVITQSHSVDRLMDQIISIFRKVVSTP
jgi:glycosyltransferase involved in cell wall biosynthesis